MYHVQRLLLFKYFKVEYNSSEHRLRFAKVATGSQYRDLPVDDLIGHFCVARTKTLAGLTDVSFNCLCITVPLKSFAVDQQCSIV